MIYFEQKSKSKIIWRVISYICAGIALFLIINFSVLAFYVKEQRSLEQEQTRIEQKIGKQLIDREITKLEKEKQEAELQRQTEERLKAEKEAEEAKEEIARKNTEQEEEMKRQQQVLAAQQVATEKEAERQTEAVKIETQKLADEQKKQDKTLLEIEKCKSEAQSSFDKFKVNVDYLRDEFEKKLKPKELEISEAESKCAKKLYEPLPDDIIDMAFSPDQLRDIRQSEYDTCMVAVHSSEKSLQAIKDEMEETIVKNEQEAKALYDKQYSECLNK